MALGADVNELLKYLKDGSEILWPELEGHDQFRGNHEQELIDFCLEHFVSIITIEALPKVKSWHPKVKDVVRDIFTQKECVDRIEKYLNNNYGVITGTVGMVHTHAIAWDGEKAFDPNGDIHDNLDYFGVHKFHIFKPIY